MESRIPLPTDNIFKFYALFGLLLFIFAAGASIYVIRSSNEVIYTSFPELEGLKQIEKPTHTETIRIKVLEKKLQINSADKVTLDYSLRAVLCVGLLLMAYGFVKWHREVQPVLDQTTKVQLEIAKLQLLQLRQEFDATQKPKTEPSDNESEERPII